MKLITIEKMHGTIKEPGHSPKNRKGLICNKNFD